MEARYLVGIGLSYRPPELEFLKRLWGLGTGEADNERLGLVIAKTGSIISGTGLLKSLKIPPQFSLSLSIYLSPGEGRGICQLS
jgi:hypothetical protein